MNYLTDEVQPLTPSHLFTAVTDGAPHSVERFWVSVLSGDPLRLEVEPEFKVCELDLSHF